MKKKNSLHEPPAEIKKALGMPARERRYGRNSHNHETHRESMFMWNLAYGRDEKVRQQRNAEKNRERRKKREAKKLRHLEKMKAKGDSANAELPSKPPVVTKAKAPVPVENAALPPQEMNPFHVLDQIVIPPTDPSARQE